VGVIQNAPNYNSALGGYAFSEGAPSPSLGAILTIDGVSVGFGGGAHGQISGTDYGTYSQSFADARDYGSAYDFYTYNFVTNQMVDPSHTIPVSITEPFSYKAKNSNGGSGQGSFQIVSFRNGYGYLIDTYASLIPTTVSMSLGDGIKGASALSEQLASGVPEPSTWAMILIGFAGLGFAFRHSRRKVSFA
jgi:hypothetical protein